MSSTEYVNEDGVQFMIPIKRKSCPLTGVTPGLVVGCVTSDPVDLAHFKQLDSVILRWFMHDRHVRNPSYSMHWMSEVRVAIGPVLRRNFVTIRVFFL